MMTVIFGKKLKKGKLLIEKEETHLDHPTKQWDKPFWLYSLRKNGNILYARDDDQIWLPVQQFGELYRSINTRDYQASDNEMLAMNLVEIGVTDKTLVYHLFGESVAQQFNKLSVA